MASRIRTFTRRALLTALGGTAAAPLLATGPKAQVGLGAPVLRNSRYQFTLLRTSKKLHDVELKGLDGRALRLSPVPGNVLLVNLWATWCGACRTELRSLERLHAGVGGRVQVAAVPIDSADRGKIQSYLDQLPVRRLPVFLDPEHQLAGNSADDPAPLTLYGMPITPATSRARLTGSPTTRSGCSHTTFGGRGPFRQRENLLRAQCRVEG